MSAPSPQDAQHAQHATAAAALRAEHDELSRRLEVRASIDAMKAGLQRLFVGLIAVGLSVKLAWDRWGTVKPGVVRVVRTGPPLFLIVAVAVAVVLLALAVRSLARARALGREEDRLFERFRELRAKLGLLP